MIIRHSLKILEQLSEFEKLIQKLEAFLDDHVMPGEQEKVLVRILKEREARLTSRRDEAN